MKKNRKPKKVKRPTNSPLDYSAIKVQYMASEFLALQEFWRWRGLKWHGSCHAKTSGWRSEKELMLAELAEREIQRLKENRQLVLDEALNVAIQVSTNSLKKIAKTDSGIKDHKAVKSHWQIIRTESGLPTNITHATNINTNEQRDIDAAEKLRNRLAKNQATSEINKDATAGDDHIIESGDRRDTQYSPF